MGDGRNNSRDRLKEAKRVECRDSVLVCFGCYDTVPQNEWLIDNRNLFLAVLRLHDHDASRFSGWLGPSSWFGDGAFSLRLHMEEGARLLLSIFV